MPAVAEKVLIGLALTHAPAPRALRLTSGPWLSALTLEHMILVGSYNNKTPY